MTDINFRLGSSEKSVNSLRRETKKRVAVWWVTPGHIIYMKFIGFVNLAFQSASLFVSQFHIDLSLALCHPEKHNYSLLHILPQIAKMCFY